MKMEVISVQNQFHRQFGILGSQKVKDWPTPLTSPSHELSLTSPSQEDARQALTVRLQKELRSAKNKHLASTEVLLPTDLLSRVATEMIQMSEKEPCGIKGCSMFIEFEDEVGSTRRIASIKFDSNTVSTFELYLTLKYDTSGWTSILPQFLKNLARGNTIMISPQINLIKNKLYRSFAE